VRMERQRTVEEPKKLKENGTSVTCNGLVAALAACRLGTIRLARVVQIRGPIFLIAILGSSLISSRVSRHSLKPTTQLSIQTCLMQREGKLPCRPRRFLMF
jgi:hypothetical protein